MLIFTFTTPLTPIVEMDKDTLFVKKRIINCGGKCIDLSDPKVIGILNITPDSFFDGGKYMDKNSILKRIEEMTAEGADIIDIGAYSSRPGAVHISEKEELQRLTTALGVVRDKHPEIILSVDTFRSGVARVAVNEYNVSIINDVSAGKLDRKMHEMVAKLQVPYILMHMPGNPRNMQSKTDYKDLINEIIDILADQVSLLKRKGVNDLIVDPGFGFGKTIEQNYQLLAHLEVFKILDCPVLAGISRKSMIYKFLDTTAENSLTGTIALNMLALVHGADILRVHDVKEAVQTIRLFLKTKEEGNKYLNLHK